MNSQYNIGDIIRNNIEPTEIIYDKMISDKYSYQNYNIPRVTEILSSMLHEDYLMKWSNSIGLYQRKKYDVVLEEAGQKGSFAHNAIEDYIIRKIELDINTIPIPFRNEVYNAYNSFLGWWSIITERNNIEIIYSEYQLINPYFGGTLDLLLKINGKIYLVDFKTSNHPSYKYFLQLAAYRYTLREYENINIHGCIILMLNKKKINFDELFLNFENSEHCEYIKCCEETFLSLVYAYYNRLRSQYYYNKIYG